MNTDAHRCAVSERYRSHGQSDALKILPFKDMKGVWKLTSRMLALNTRCLCGVGTEDLVRRMRWTGNRSATIEERLKVRLLEIIITRPPRYDG